MVRIPLGLIRRRMYNIYNYRGDDPIFLSFSFPLPCFDGGGCSDWRKGSASASLD